MISWTDVVNVAPELATFPVAAQPTIIAQTYMQLDAGAWGALLDTGAAWLAAHIATMTTRRGRAGTFESGKVGQVSTSWAVLPGSSSRLDATGYGQEFRRLIDTNVLFRVGRGQRSSSPSFGSTVAAWKPSTLYAVGNLAQSNRNIYSCTQIVGAGESSAGAGPIGVGINIPDFQTVGVNGVYWAFLGSTGSSC